MKITMDKRTADLLDSAILIVAVVFLFWLFTR